MKRVWVDRDKCLGCKSCELQCAVERNSVSKKLAGAILEDPKPVARVGVFGPTGASFPLQCRHCQDATCLMACPNGAMQRDAEKATTFVAQDKCRGCWMCVMSCPFGAVTPIAEYKVAMKCDACMHMEQPACVTACPTGALVYGDEETYGKVLRAKRGRIAVYAKSVSALGQATIISLDVLKEGN
jgi:anaerobic carbon-monoxide dehydrogenase iron sulfur subunit